MKVLFITSSRLGDAVLSTGLIDHILNTCPDARITVCCGALPASLFEGMPQLDKIIALKKERFHGHWFRLWRMVAGTKWGMVVDMRDSAVSRLIRADRRYIHGKHIDRNMHKVEQAAALMGIDPPPAPVIFVSPQQRKKAEALVPDGGPVIGVGPTANWIGKTWPVDRFIAVVEHITGPDGILPGARVAVFAAPGEEADACRLLTAVPEGRRIDVIARADPGTAAAALSRCALYVGNDSGLMHCAAAARVPTVGLFGPSYPRLYRPWGAHTAWASTPESFDELTAFDGYDPKTLDRSLMTSLSVQDVVFVIEEFWKARVTASQVSVK